MNSNNNNEYNSILFYKIFHNNILRDKIFEDVHKFNILSMGRERISCEQLKNNQFTETPFSSYYTRLAIHCQNEDQLFDLFDSIEIPSTVNRFIFSFNSIRSEIEIVINNSNLIKSNPTITNSSNKSTASIDNNSISNNSQSKLKVLSEYMDTLYFQITSLNGPPSTNILKEIESRVIPESSKLIQPSDPSKRYSNTCIPFTIRIVSMKLGPWFNDKIKFGWVPINQRLEKLILCNDFNNIIQIGGLNESFHLKEIQFGNSFNQDLDIGVLPETLETIVFGNSFNRPLKKDGILPKSLTCIRFDKSSLFNSDFSFKNLKALKTVMFGCNCTEKLSESILPSESLTKLSVYNPKQIKSFKSNWFKKLEILKVKEYEYNRKDEYILEKGPKVQVIKSIPLSVRTLRIEGNIAFDQAIVSKVTQLSVFPTRFLRDLGFKLTNNQSIRQLKLYLNGGAITDQLAGARNIESLEIHGRFNQHLENITLSSTLKVLKIKTNFNQFVRLSHNSSIQVLVLGKLYQQPFLANELPSSLTYLKIESLTYTHGINKQLLPPSLLALSVELNNLSQLESLPDGLQSLEVQSFHDQKNEINNLAQCLPSSITLLSLHSNMTIQLSSKWLPSQIKNIIIKNGYFDYENQLAPSLISIYIPYFYNISYSFLCDKYISRYIKIIQNNPTNLFNKLSNLNLFES